jgi:hypothetical protein
MRERLASAPLREGGVAVRALQGDRLTLIRMTKSGEAVEVIIERGVVRVQPSPPVAPELYEQWRSGSKKRPVRFDGEGFVVGSGPELGDWNRERAVKLPVTLDLPVNGVFEFKRLTPAREWEPGDNQVIVTAPEPR